MLRMPPVSMIVIGPPGPSTPPGFHVIFSTDPALKIALEEPLYGNG